ncbi:MAG: polysaccharide ABC transporter ATP-binding protein [Bacteroidia bacterium]
MSDVVISVENLGKQYRLGNVGTGTLSSDLKRWWHLARGKEDPFLKVGEENNREKRGNSDYVWALKDIDFEVKKGEVLGIIGKNGAGKSTLLKILSRTTTPTTGNFKVKGRIASLLEVGTGFHPELTGRENIFLNGAILGMTKIEIKKKFDEIVDFSGVERYIDTPVKRYSSGMYVRLAFAVAAHLESEILILDEVLAVGDAEFQKKCLGKMKDVSGTEGRTVLFVSHNENAVRNLCKNALLLEQGKIILEGSVNSVFKQYEQIQWKKENENGQIIWNESNAPGSKEMKLKSIFILNENDEIRAKIDVSESIKVKINYEILEEIPELRITLKFVDNKGNIFLKSIKSVSYFNKNAFGNYESTCIIPKNIFEKGKYKLLLYFGIPFYKTLIENESFLSVEINTSENNFGLLKKSQEEISSLVKWETLKRV